MTESSPELKFHDWENLKKRWQDNPEYQAGCAEAKLAYELGDQIRSIRRSLKMTQKQLAELSGMTQPAVARFEAGGTIPTLPVLQRLAAALGLTLTVELKASKVKPQTPVVLNRRAAI
ncbi:MAG: XRE family transcriptional regulator [Actinobacteria bacterium]|nr:XRE family transcriptional regulator [Actinomycetota bacterium]